MQLSSSRGASGVGWRRKAQRIAQGIHGPNPPLPPRECQPAGWRVAGGSKVLAQPQREAHGRLAQQAVRLAGAALLEKQHLADCLDEAVVAMRQLEGSAEQRA